jgi:hypothetical protein
LETGDRRQETGDRRQETGDRRQETGKMKSTIASSKRILNILSNIIPPNYVWGDYI